MSGPDRWFIQETGGLIIFLAGIEYLPVLHRVLGFVL